MPKNDNPLSRRIEEAKFAADNIRIGEIMFGRILLIRILISLYPNTLDAKI